jgi:hypothetical protein
LLLCILHSSSYLTFRFESPAFKRTGLSNRSFWKREGLAEDGKRCYAPSYEEEKAAKRVWAYRKGNTLQHAYLFAGIASGGF